MGNYFKIHYNAVKYPIDSEKSRGLRNAQLGAIHAISSFFTLNKKEAAIVIMPTGSGKTAVLMLTPYLIRKQRVLVVTPSKMVRGQIAEDFSELKAIPDRIQEVLAATDSYVKKAGKVNRLRIMGSI